MYGDTRFAVMKDEKTIFGIKSSSKRVIVKEDITGDRSGSCPVLFYKHTKIINTIMISEELNVMLAGDDNGNVVQYDLITGKIQVDYGNLRIGDVVSLQCIGPIAFVGGWKSNLMRVLFMDIRQAFGLVFKTSIYSLSSLQVCFVNNPNNLKGNRLLLCISGYNPTYNDQVSDILDATQLVKYYQKEANPGTIIVDFCKKSIDIIQYENKIFNSTEYQFDRTQNKIQKMESNWVSIFNKKINIGKK